MPSHDLTPLQKNAVLEAIKKARLDRREFDWSSVATQSQAIGRGLEPFMVPVLLHRPTGFAFLFDVDRNGSHQAIYRPGPQGPTYHADTHVWSEQLSHVGLWLNDVRENHLAPDLWAALETQQDLIASLSQDDADDNSPFTAPERELIAQQLRELKEQIAQGFELQGAALNQLEERVEYLIDATARLGRFDWKQALLSQLLSLIVLALLPPEALAAIVQYLTGGFVDLVRGSGTAELPGAPLDKI